MFKLGDLVRLKSGGPMMTVVYISPDGQIVCKWFTGSDPEWEGPKTEPFVPSSLEADPSAASTPGRPARAVRATPA